MPIPFKMALVLVLTLSRALTTGWFNHNKFERFSVERWEQKMGRIIWLNWCCAYPDLHFTKCHISCFVNSWNAIFRALWKMNSLASCGKCMIQKLINPIYQSYHEIWRKKAFKKILTRVNNRNWENRIWGALIYHGDGGGHAIEYEWGTVVNIKRDSPSTRWGRDGIEDEKGYI